MNELTRVVKIQHKTQIDNIEKNIAEQLGTGKDTKEGGLLRDSLVIQLNEKVKALKETLYNMLGETADGTRTNTS